MTEIMSLEKKYVLFCCRFTFEIINKILYNFKMFAAWSYINSDCIV